MLILCGVVDYSSRPSVAKTAAKQNSDVWCLVELIIGFMRICCDIFSPVIYCFEDCFRGRSIFWGVTLETLSEIIISIMKNHAFSPLCSRIFQNLISFIDKSNGKKVPLIDGVLADFSFELCKIGINN